MQRMNEFVTTSCRKWHTLLPGFLYQCFSGCYRHPLFIVQCTCTTYSRRKNTLYLHLCTCRNRIFYSLIELLREKYSPVIFRELQTKGDRIGIKEKMDKFSISFNNFLPAESQ